MKTMKIIALILSVALVLSLAGGCSSTRYVMTIDGEDIKAGIYIISQVSAVNEAKGLFFETYPDVDTSEDGFDYAEFQLEGVNFFDWVKEKAIETTVKIMVVEKMFKERELSFDDEETANIKEEIDQQWETDKQLQELYEMMGEQALQFGGAGGETWGQYFEKSGVSKESFVFFHTNVEKERKLFDSFYGEDGTNPVPDKEWQSIFEKNYARVRIVELSFVDDEGEELPKEQQVELRAYGEELLEELKEGEYFVNMRMAYGKFREELLHECCEIDCAEICIFDEVTTEEDADDTEEEDTDADDTEEEDTDEEDTNADDTDEEESDTDEDDWDIFEEMDKEAETYARIDDIPEDNEVLEHISKMGFDVPEIYQMDDADLIIMRLDTLGNEEVFEEYREIVVGELKRDEFDAMLDEHAEEMRENDIIINQSAIDRYNPRKFI